MDQNFNDELGWIWNSKLGVSVLTGKCTIKNGWNLRVASLWIEIKFEVMGGCIVQS